MADLRRWLAAMTGAVQLVATTAAAQPAPAPPPSQPPPTDVTGVTVTGERHVDPTLDAASEFVNRRLPTGISNQYARFRDPICVRVDGLTRGFEAFIAARVIAVAHQVGAPVSRINSCTPNVRVIVTSEPQALLSAVGKRRAVLLGFYYSDAQKSGLATFHGPVEARYVTSVRDPEGKPNLEVYDPTAFLHPIAGRAGSRLSNGMSAELVHSLILIDANRLAGEKIGAVADYVSVLALSRWQGIQRCSAIPTILNLMADECGEGDTPEAATPADLGLLRGLYSTDPLSLGVLQRANIARHMRDGSPADPPAK